MLLSVALLAMAHGTVAWAGDTCRETHVTLHNGVEMPRVGFGLAGMHGEDTMESVGAHLRAGFRMLDGAEATEWYDDEAAGIQLSRTKDVARRDVFIVTKVHPRNLGEKQTRSAVMRMLDRWNHTEYIDAVLLHFLECGSHIPDCKGKRGGDWKGSWRALEQLYSEGVVRAIGVSNLYGQQEFDALYAHAKVKPHIIQNWMDPFRQFRDDYERAINRGAAYMAYSSLGEQHVGQVGKNLVMLSPSLNEIAQKHDVSVPAVVLAWQLNLPGLVIIPRSRHVEHIEQNARLLDPSFVAGLLDKDDVARIDALDETYDVRDDCAQVKRKCKSDARVADQCRATCAGKPW